MPVEKVQLIATISRRLFSAIAALLVVLTLLGLVGGKLWPKTFEASANPPSTPAESDVVGRDSNKLGFDKSSPPPMVAVVVGLGALGGFVGLQRRLKGLPVEDLQLLATSWLYALLSPLVGGVLALVLYALFMSGLLAGELFPKLCPETSKDVEYAYSKLLRCAPETVTAYAKLFFWSFVAGFSERFVVDIIGQFEHQATEQPQQPGLSTPRQGE